MTISRTEKKQKSWALVPCCRVLLINGDLTKFEIAPGQQKSERRYSRYNQNVEFQLLASNPLPVAARQILKLTRVCFLMFLNISPVALT